MMMAHPLFQRHPRYVVASAAGLITLMLLLASNHYSEPQLGLYASRPSSAVAGKSTTAGKLAEAESDYTVNVARRNALIRDIGPDPNKIDAWPVVAAPKHMYTLWDFFLPAFQCPHKLQRVGTLGDGGKWVCGLEKVANQKKGCVVYSVGINGESSFEAELLQSTTCQLWGYDYSVKEFGPEIESVPALKERSHFFPYALGGTDDHAPGAAIPFYTLPTLMKMNGHDFIDILKIDIEGFEFSVLTDIINAYKGRPLPFGQLQLEIHAWGKTFLEVLTWWEALEAAGLRPFHTEPNLVYTNLYRGHAPDLSEYSFINIKGNHAVLSD
ncbi:hypothetical protein FRB99_001145 [Tulasnella sp. 403]|nr:hypothetical protein FRB99_001145 [Tulasnella sp. 403]